MLTGKPLQIEQQVFSENGAIIECLNRQGARLQMRPLRVAVEDFSYEFDSVRRILEMQLRLPAGSYVTVLLEHFLRVIEAG